MRKTIQHKIPIIILFFLSTSLLGQISEGGLPASFGKKLSPDAVPVAKIQPPDMDKVQAQDSSAHNLLKPARMAVLLPVSISFSEAASWKYVDGSWIGRLALQSQEAKALIVYYDRFQIPENGKLFLYDEHKKQVAGAFTNRNNPPDGLFATELVYGDHVVLEYNYPHNDLQKPDLMIGDVGYAYRYTGKSAKGFGGSGECEINVNCSDGDGWRDEQRGVARILIRRGGGAYWCSGTLMNNTNQDYRPYLLSADHCGGDASDSDLQQWAFYFNFEAPGCENPDFEPDYQSMVGAELISRSGTQGSSGSDFYLVELNNFVPADYDAYFNGWNRVNSPANSGVTIHHPAGDIKKITTYSEALESATYDNAINAHWKVYWTTTNNGAGATEGGSSGSPLFDEQGLVVGALTGGLSSCENQTLPDYYGKMSYSWDMNGDMPNEQLAPWLDPQDAGVMTMQGLGGQPPNVLIADFAIDGDTSLPIGSMADFQSLSFGSIVSWQWQFEGGEPKTSQEKDPTDVLFDTYGNYDVSLTITGINGDTNTIVKKDYIRVRAKAFPNPVTDKLTLDFGQEPIGTLNLFVYNIFGESIIQFEKHFPSQTSYDVDMRYLPEGLYLVRANVNGDVSEYKVFKAKHQQ